MVACPQNGTSHSGEKYRTRHESPSGAAKAVSENPTSAAIACIFDAGGKSSPIQIPAGLPPLLLSENAAIRRTVMLVVLFPFSLFPCCSRFLSTREDGSFFRPPHASLAAMLRRAG